MVIAIIIEAILTVMLFIAILKDNIRNIRVAKCRGEKPDLFAFYFGWVIVSLVILFQGMKIWWLIKPALALI